MVMHHLIYVTNVVKKGTSHEIVQRMQRLVLNLSSAISSVMRFSWLLFPSVFQFDRWEGGSTPRRFSKAHKKKITQYEDPWKKSGKSRRRGGNHNSRSSGWKSPSTPGRSHKVNNSSDSVENSSQSPFKKNNLFTGSPSNHHGYSASRFHKSHGYFEGT